MKEIQELVCISLLPLMPYVHFLSPCSERLT